MIDSKSTKFGINQTQLYSTSDSKSSTHKTQTDWSLLLEQSTGWSEKSSLNKAIDTEYLTNIIWTGFIDYQTQVQFSGQLTVSLDPFSLTEGETITLFQFASSTGKFDDISIDAGSCVISTTAEYGETALILQVDTVSCSQLQVGVSLSLCL